MKSIRPTLISAAALAALSMMPVAAQAQADKPAATEAAKPAAAATKRSRSSVDARKCLELATNIEIHKCAEKYR